jgi:hypothetical protein
MTVHDAIRRFCIDELRVAERALPAAGLTPRSSSVAVSAVRVAIAVVPGQR